MNLENGTLTLDNDQSIDISEREVEILRYLSSNANRTVSRDELLAEVWKIDPRGLQSRTIDMHIARLRDKLKGSPANHMIQTVRGRGHMFVGTGKTP